MADKNKGNPVSNQSKLWMEDSLLKLMQTEKYQEITIQEITDYAGLSRRTFYRNYSSKDEILEGYFYRIWQDYRLFILHETDLSLPNIAKVFFTEMQKHQDFLLLINRHQLLPLFLAKVDELLPLAFYATKGEQFLFPPKSIQYALKFSTGGFMRILTQWLNGGAQESPEDMAEIVRDFIVMCSYPNPLEN